MSKGKIILLVILLALGGATAYVYFMGTPAFLTPYLGGGSDGSENKVSKTINVNIPDDIQHSLDSGIKPKPEGEVDSASKASDTTVVKEGVKVSVPAVQVKKEEPKVETAVKPVSSKPVSKPKTTISGVDKVWVVNVGSFQKKDPARETLKKLKKEGYQTYITSFKKSGVLWYRVRVGFYGSRAEAESVSGDIASKFGITGAWIVKASTKEVKYVTEKYFKSK